MRYIVLFLILVPFLGFSQPGQAPLELKEGVKYYVHTVEAGNTLFGLQRTYGTTVEQIVADNQGVEKGLVVGQKVYIRVALVTVEHVVQKKETIYAISRKYGVSVNDILTANPGLEENIQVGQMIRIPGVDKSMANGTGVTDVVEEKPVENAEVQPVVISFEDSIIEYKVLDQETLYSISKRFMVPIEELQKVNGMKSSKIRPGDILKIPVKKESIEKIEIREVPQVSNRKVDSTLLFPAKSNYKVALLLPLNLEKGPSDYVGSLATDFYMGAQLALDSLEKKGLKAEVFVYDTKNDTISLKKTLSKPEFNDMDIVIGPLFSENSEYVGKWCKERGVRMICPVAASPTMLRDNPYIYHAVPSDLTLMKGLAEYILKNHSKEQILLVKPKNEKDRVLYDAFRSAYMALPVNGSRPKLVDLNPQDVITYVKRGLNTVVVYPATDKASIMSFHNDFNVEIAKYSATSFWVYGTKEWLNYDEVSVYNSRYSFGYSSPNDFQYTYPEVISLHRKFRSEFKGDMSKMAVQGFDVINYFLGLMVLGIDIEKQVMNEYSIDQLGAGNGYENTNACILVIENGEFKKMND